MFWEIDRGGGATNNTTVDSSVEELVRSHLLPLTASDCECMSSPGQDSSSSRRKSRARPVQPLIDPDSLTAFHAKRLALGTPTLIDRLIFRNKSALFEEMETKKRGPGRPPNTLKTNLLNKTNVLKRKRTKSPAGTTADSPTLKRLRSRKETGSESDSSMDSRNHSLERKTRTANSANKSSPQGKNKPSKKLRKGKKSRCSERILNSHLRSGKKRNELHSKQQRRKRSLSDNSSTKERKDSNFNLKDNNFNSNVSEEQNEDTVGDSTDSEVSRTNTKLGKKPISAKKEEHILLEEEGKRKRRRRKKRDSMWVMKVKKKFNTKRDNVKEDKTFPISPPPPHLLTEETLPKEDSAVVVLPSKLLPDLPVLDKVNIEDFTGNIKHELAIKTEEVDVDMPKLEKQVEVEFAPKKETEPVLEEKFNESLSRTESDNSDTISVQSDIDKGINISILALGENEQSTVVMDEPSVDLEELTKHRETINDEFEAAKEETDDQETVQAREEDVSNLPPEETVVSEPQELVITEVSGATIVDEYKKTEAGINQITQLDTANHLKREDALSNLVSLVVQDLEGTTNLNKEIKDPVDTDNKTESVINQVFETKGPINEKRQEEDEPLPVADSTSELNQSLDDSFNEFTLSLPDDLELGSPEHPGQGEDMDTSMFPDSTDTSHAEMDRSKEEEEEDIQDDCNQITSHSEVEEKGSILQMDTVKENGLENEDLRSIEEKEKSLSTMSLEEGEVENSRELEEEITIGEAESPKGIEKETSCEVVKMLEVEESMSTLEGQKEKVEDETLRAECEDLIVSEVKSPGEVVKSGEQSVPKEGCNVDMSEEASKCDIEKVLHDLSCQKSSEKERMKKEELSLEQRQLKESVLQALGLKSSAGTSRVSPPAEKPKIDGYTGTLKAVIKLNRNRDKNKIISGSSEDSMIGELEYRICSEIPTSETVPISRLDDKNHQSNDTSTSHNGSLSNNGLHSSDEHLDHNQPSSSCVGKDLIIPEKSSSFSIHPGRLCSDVCSYCFGKFGSLDTPCHIGQLKADRQKKILESKFLEETHLTVESCLCDACFRYIDRKANSPPTKPGAPRGGSRVKSSVCCVSNCTEEATRTVRKKWLVKMKKSIANKLDIDFNKSAAMYYFPLCENHHNWVDYFTVCGICRKRLSRNHFFTVGSDSDRLNLMLAVDGIPARLSDKLFICKLCKNYSDIRLQADDLEDLPSSSYLYCREYRKKILQALDHPVSDSDEELVSLASSSGGGATSGGGTTSSSRDETKVKKKESERIGHSSPVSSPSPESSQDGLLNLPCVGILLRDKASQETTIQMVKVGNASIGGLNTINPSPRSGLHPEERVPYPQEIGLQANMDFQGSAVPDASWERCVSTIQFDKKTKNLWQELQKPYGNQSSFLRHLVHLEKYWRSGYLTLATGADERAAKYLNLVRNRIKAFEGNGGFSTSPTCSSTTVISTSSAGTSTNSFDPMLMNTSEIEVRPIPPPKKPVEKKPQPILTPLDRAKALVRMATPSQRVTPPPRYPSPGSSSIQRFQVPPMYISQGYYQPQSAQNQPPPLLKIRKMVPSTSNPPPPSCTTSLSIMPHQYNQGLQLRKVRPLYGRLPVTMSQVPTSVTLNKAGITIEKQTGSSPLTPPSLPIEKPSISVFREPAPSPSPTPGFILP